MIDDLDKTIAELLNSELPEDLKAAPVAISFATPDNAFPGSADELPAINFFLYDIRENMELRSTERQIERRNNGHFVEHLPPVRVDCSYLITAWSKSTDKPAEEEHRFLGEVMKVLLRHRKYPAEVLQGDLIGQEPPVRVKVLQPGYLTSMGEFWQAMGGTPRAVLNYTVTISVDVSPPLELEPVTDMEIRLKQK